jgi:putative endonuclease
VVNLQYVMRLRMQHFVYIIKSLKARRFYTGYTLDLKRRVTEHNQGNTKSTKPFKPWKLIYSEVFGTKSEAYKREWHLKHLKGRKDKLEIIEKYGGIA